jgi:hypothetical protein
MAGVLVAEMLIFDRGDDRVRLEGELPAWFREGLIM